LGFTEKNNLIAAKYAAIRKEQRKISPAEKGQGEVG